MGRIHRYGQDKEVYIFNLVASDTREGEVVEKLLEKLDVMREELGSDAVFDVLGSISGIDEGPQGKSLEQLFRQALARRRSFDEILAEIDAQYDPVNADLVRKARLEGLATDRIDFSGVRQRQQASEEHRLMPAYIERFFVEAFEALGEGTLQEREDSVWAIDWLRAALRDVPRSLVRRFGEPKKRYRRFTFHKERAKSEHAASLTPEFVAPGHPLFEAVRYQAEDRFTSALREGAVFYDPEGREGRLWFLRGSVRDGHGDVVGERLFAVFEAEDGDLEQWSLTVLLDLDGAEESPNIALKDAMPEARKRVIDWSLDHCLDPYFEELTERRTREAEIKRRYLTRSFNTRISASMKKIGQHKRREQEGANMEMAIRQEQMRKDELIERRERRLAEVTSERYLSPRTPEVVGVAVVLPQPRELKDARGGMRSSEEVERIAMEVAMAHERQRGWRPEDVSEENLGFDVRSHGPGDEMQRIEVKGRAGEGAVRLSPNEWLKAQQLGETFWLYIVVNCASEPRLWVMQDPASRLEPEEEVQVTSYRVEHSAWRAIAEQREVSYG
jgi:hypothetical protein